MLIFTQLASDNFQRANENPLSQGGNWTEPNGFYGYYPMQLLNNQCVASVAHGEGDANYTGVSFPNDQYAEFKIAALGNVSEGFNFPLAGFVLRWGPTQEHIGYYFLIITNDDGSHSAEVNFGSVGVPTVPVTVSVGDVFRAAVIGSMLYFYKNGVLLTSGQDSTYSFGELGLDLVGPAADCAITNFAAGSVVDYHRFLFLAESTTPQPGVQQYTVVDSGDSKRVGAVFWDNVVARAWSFNLQDNQPFIAAGSNDAAEISTFASALPTPAGINTVYDPTVKASSRFQFIPVVRRSGEPALAYIVIDGPTQTEGSEVGRIIWNGTADAWCFLQTNASANFAYAGDVNCLLNLVASLSPIIPNQIQL